VNSLARHTIISEVRTCPKCYSLCACVSACMSRVVLDPDLLRVSSTLYAIILYITVPVLVFHTSADLLRGSAIRLEVLVNE
jgi:hypothetical protein